MMTKDNLETRCKKAVLRIADTVLRIADTVQDANMKLCHLIKSYRNSFYSNVGKHNYKNSEKAYNNSE